MAELVQKKSNFWVETTKHSAVAMALLGALGITNLESAKTFAADVVKDEVNKEIQAELGSLKEAQDKQKEAVNKLVNSQDVLAEQIKASNENVKNLIELMKATR